MSDQNFDHQLVKKISQGDSKAFESLLAKYQDIVYGLAKKLTQNQALAEDMAQETWMNVIKNAEQYSPVGSVKSWILQICRNKIIDEFRKQKKWKNTEDIDDIEIADFSENAFDHLDQNENQKIFDQVFSKLDERERVVLSYYIVDELSYAEIATKMNLSLNGVKTIIHRTKEKMKLYIENPKEAYEKK